MNPWLQISSAESPRARIACLPRAGGTAADFATWGRAFDGDVEVCAVQLPGRLRRYREPAMRAAAPIAREVIRAVKELDDLPLVLFGDCMGAIVAYEIARQLPASSFVLATTSGPTPRLRR